MVGNVCWVGVDNCAITGAAGGWVSTIKSRVLETAERFPLLIDFAVMA
jgi:hypothetical protein